MGSDANSVPVPLPALLPVRPTSPQLAFVFRRIPSAGLPAPVYEHPVPHPEGTYYIDLAYLKPRKVAVECIGRIGHDFERAFETDPVRRNYLQINGWLVLEVTWRRFVNQPESVIAEVLQALAP